MAAKFATMCAPRMFLLGTKKPKNQKYLMKKNVGFVASVGWIARSGESISPIPYQFLKMCKP
jgi:hypothetical protein